MAELSLRERLQPALLDRLVDDERLLAFFQLTLERSTLERLGLKTQELIQIVAAQGLAPRELSEHDRAAEQVAREHGLIRLCFVAPAGRVSVSRLKALVLRPPRAPEGVQLQSFCSVAVHSEPNLAPESVEQRQISGRRLRELVCRDLTTLLNSTSLETSVDLSSLEHVRRSVINYGMPSFIGRSPRSLELRQVARTIEEAIAQFEPRLTEVKVTPESSTVDDEHQINFRIDAQLWGQPVPQRLLLRTRISTDSGDVSVSDPGVRAAS
jgi:type VI secretion system protein ImpF